MPSGEETSTSDGSPLSFLLAPLRLPERALDTLDSLAAAARHLEPIRDLIEQAVRQTEQVPEMLAVVRRISRQAEPLDQMLPALDHLEESMGKRLDSVREVIVKLESDESHLNEAVEELKDHIVGLHATLRSLQDDVQRVTDRLPDPDRGPLEKAKDVLTGSGG